MTNTILPRISATRKTSVRNPVPTCPASRAASAAEAHSEMHCVSSQADSSEIEALLAQVREALGFDFAADIEDSIVNPARIDDWLAIGGFQIGLGDWRPQHGRFTAKRQAGGGR